MRYHAPYSTGTSALGAIRNSAPPVCAWIIGGALSIPGTSAAIFDEQRYSFDEGTTAGLVLKTPVSVEDRLAQNRHAEDAGQAIRELRRLSGLTWDHIAQIFDVNRRSVHFWASGKAMTQSHEEKLYKILSVIRFIDKGTASGNRSSLLKIETNGVSALDMLKNDNFNGVINTIDVSSSPQKTPPKLSSSEFERRIIPAAPEQLLGARNEKIHEEVGPKKRIMSSQIRKN